MKKILLFGGVITLLTTTGCLVDGRGRGHGEYRGHADVVVDRPAVVVAVPVVVVRPPEVIVR